MRKLFILIILLSNWSVISQSSFNIDKNGLSPKSIEINSTSQNSGTLYSKINHWFSTKDDRFKRSKLESIGDSIISFTSTKSDVRLRKDKAYYVRYNISLKINDPELLFSVNKIDLKQNSRFDMGWKELDLKKPNEFFKNNKGNKKAFLKAISQNLNELFQSLNSFLNKN